MEVFSHGGSFHGVHLDSIFDEKYVAERNMVQDVVAEIIKTEMVKPIQIKVFDYAECEQAFR